MRHKFDELHRGIEFIERNRARILRIAQAELKDKGCADPEGHAEDVASEISLTLVMKWPTLRSPDDAMYIFTVNKARSHARLCRREFADEIKEHQAPFFSRPGRDPDEMIQEMEFLNWVLSNLSDAEVKVFQMRFIHEMAFASIADLLQKPLGTVTSSYTRILKKLGKAIEVRAEVDHIKRRVPAPES
ncbi:MAG TPA: sigma-70 family RNA polymerase sigma factor [Pyrinomonadaceae bacterium]|jgi:RNA polymerase sigma factor (sigma-70 family)|nr:sigma-70 family RNA polymerase sigma factor [Pyrinomonadaceae bacterium]